MKEVEAVKDLSTVTVISNLLTKHKGQQFADVWNLGINLALRISDLLELKFDDLTGTHVTVIETKTKKPRTIKLNDKAKAIIERRRLENSDDVYLFQSKSRNMKEVKAITRQAVGKAFSEVGEMVSVHLSTHSMRKTRGYHVYKQTNNLALVMKMLNHSSPSITLRYIGIDQEELDSISDSISL